MDICTIAKMTTDEIVTTNYELLAKNANNLAQENAAKAREYTKKQAIYILMGLGLLMGAVCIFFFGVSNNPDAVILILPLSLTCMIAGFAVAGAGIGAKSKAEKHSRGTNRDELIRMFAETSRLSAIHTVLQDHWFCPYCTEINHKGNNNVCCSCGKTYDEIITSKYHAAIVKSRDKLPPTIQ